MMMRSKGALWLAVGLGSAVFLPAGEKAVLILNEDNSHFFGSRTAEQMNLAGLNQFVDQYADSAVTHLFLCPNAMRANFRSHSRDAIWDPAEGVVPTGRWPANAKLLDERGLDPYAVWIARCREKGISPWLSMRMNDVHEVGHPENFMHSTFWRQHPELWRVPNESRGSWTNRALNYAHPAVREYEMAFVRELLERYDPDGLELDWMRFGYHLTPGREQEEAHLLTEFMAQVRELTKEWATKRGHPILLAARVPTHPDAAAGLGMDGVAWAKAGLVDWLIPAPFWSSTDFDIPVELWKERLGNVPVRIAPGAEFNARPWPGGKPVANDLASLAGFSASAWERGADGIYLFNWMDSGTRPVPAPAYQQLLTQGLGRAAVLATPRRYPVCYRDTVPAGFPNEVRLPITGEGTCQVHIGPAPTGGTACIIAGLAVEETADFQVAVNGTTAGAAEKWPTLAGLGGGAKLALRFPVPLASLVAGSNTIHLQAQPGSETAKVVWVEMRLEP